MKKKDFIRFISLFFLISIHYSGYALQNDSIPAIVSHIRDTAQITQYLDLAKEIRNTDKDSAESLFRIAEYAAYKLSDEKKIIESSYEYALFLYLCGRQDQAFKRFSDVMHRAELINYEKYFYWAKVYVGTIYMLRSNYNIATDYNLEGLKYFEDKKDYSATSGILLNLTYIQIEQNDPKKAEEYADLAYEYAVLSDHAVYKSKSLLNIGELAFERSAYESSLDYYKQSLQIAREIGFSDFYSTIFLNIGASYLALNKLDSALFYAEKVINNDKMTDADLFIIPKGFLLISEVYEQKNDYYKAVEYSLNALRFSDSVKLFQISASAYNYLSQYYSKLGNYKKAYEYKLKSSTILDSIFTEEKYRIQNDLEAVYETSKKEKEIQMLSKQNEITKLKNQRFQLFIYLLLFFVIIAIIIAYLVIRHNKIKTKHRTIEIEQKLFRSQMNPHFIFNSISSVQDFIMNNEPLEANSYLSDFAKLMRAILTNSSNDFIAVKQDIKTNEHYLKLQHLRMSDKFTYEINYSEQLNVEEIMVPPMLLQPFIENSIKHGISEKTDGSGKVSVNYYEESDYIVLECEDNGVGRKKTLNKDKGNHKSMAVEITEQRIKLLSKEYDQYIQFHIYDLTDKEGKSLGTKVQFKLPSKV